MCETLSHKHNTTAATLHRVLDSVPSATKKEAGKEDGEEEMEGLSVLQSQPTSFGVTKPTPNATCFENEATTGVTAFLGTWRS